MIELAGYRIEALRDGCFRLDGGAMFGVVPQTLWREHAAPDADNRIGMGLRCLLLRGHGRVVLVDTGMGDKWPPKLAARFALDQTEHNLARSLAAAGVAPEDVTDVILTHLHFDHAGGATVRGDDGALTPRFPNATYHVGRAQWHWAHDPTDKDHASYHLDDFDPIEAAGQLRLVDAADPTLLPNVTALFTDGHTVGMMHPLVQNETRDEALFHCADLVPTAAHLPFPWVMGYDLHPLTTLKEKQRILPRAAAEGWVLVFEHDDACPAARIYLDERGRPKISEVVTL